MGIKELPSIGAEPEGTGVARAPCASLILRYNYFNPVTYNTKYLQKVLTFHHYFKSFASISSILPYKACLITLYGNKRVIYEISKMEG